MQKRLAIGRDTVIQTTTERNCGLSKPKEEYKFLRRKDKIWTIKHILHVYQIMNTFSKQFSARTSLCNGFL